MKMPTVPVTAAALRQRVGRKLIRQGQHLRQTRAEHRNALGEFFVTAEGGGIVRHHVALEPLARELGCIREWERIGTEF